MSRNVPTGQLVGGLIEYAIWFAVGAYFAWFRPRRIRKAVEAGKISEEESRARLKKISPLLGYLVMLLAIAFAVSEFI